VAVLVCLFPIALGACSVLNTDVGRGYATNGEWRIGTAFTTGDVRLVTQREHPVTHQKVVCAEPSPDVAKALATTASAAIQAPKAAGDIYAGVSGGSAEGVAELAGRSTALLGLRDGLFRACEGYGNGALGDNTYALLISRYSQLMTTLFLGEDITDATNSAARATIPATALTTTMPAPPAPSAPAPNPKNTTPAPSTGSTPSTGTTTSTSLPAESSSQARLIKTANSFGAPAKLQLAAAHAAAPAAAAPADPGSGNTPSGGGNTPQANSTAGAAPSSTPSQTASSAGVSAAAAFSLTRMNEDYIHQGILDILVISCINEFDPTRTHLTASDGSIVHNEWLSKLCLAADTPAAIAGLVAAEETLPSERASLVDPTASLNPAPAPSPAPSQQGAKQQEAPANCPASSKAVTTVPVIAYQGALKAAGLYAGKLDGKAGPETKAALTAYQKANNLCQSGVADQATLASLKLVAAA
jgi:hypothetical protein